MRRVPLVEASTLALCLLLSVASADDSFFGAGLPAHEPGKYADTLLNGPVETESQTTTVAPRQTAVATQPEPGAPGMRSQNGARNFLGHYLNDEELLAENDGDWGDASDPEEPASSELASSAPASTTGTRPSLINPNSNTGFTDPVVVSSEEPESGGWVDNTQLFFEGVGAADPTGIVDFLNGTGYLFRGRWMDAGISYLGIIPYIGDTAKLGKWGVKGANALADSRKLTEGAQQVIKKFCFLAGTLVQLKDERRAIETLQVGDLVLSRDEHTGEQGFKEVVRLFRGHTSQVVYLQIAGASSSQQLRCTTEHPFWVQGRGWVNAQDLRSGDPLLGSQGEALVVVGQEVRREEADHFNVEVADWHTYFVSETAQDPAVWSHNKCYYKKPKQKARNSSVGDTVRSPSSHADDFTRNSSGQYVNKNTGEVWERSFTNHSKSPGGEWKVGTRRGQGPTKGNKITLDNDGTILKFD